MNAYICPICDYTYTESTGDCGVREKVDFTLVTQS